MADAPTRTPHEIINELRDEVERLRNDRNRAEAERTRLERDRDRLRRENERLRQQLDAARRAGFRQAAPFSKGAPKSHPRRPGRTSGATYGRQGHRPMPSAVDDTCDVPIPPTCPGCGGPVEDTHVTAQYQEDLPPVRPFVRRFDVHVGRCRDCGRRVQGRHRLQTSDALGAAAVQVGPCAVATRRRVSINNWGCRSGKIVTLFADRFGLVVTRGAVVRAGGIVELPES